MPPAVAELLGRLQSWPVAELLREPNLAYPLVSTAHILAIGLLFAPVALLDLRLIGFFARLPLASLAPFLSRAAAVGLCLAVATGILLMSVRPLHYAGNPAFLAKVSLAAAGTLNALVLHFTSGWRSVLAGNAPGLYVRAAAGLSLAFWLAAVFAGRMIAFVE